MNGNLRLFWALELPQEVKAALAQAQRELKRTGADVRWVRIEAIHLTLKFLGPVPPERVADIVEALRPVAAACPPLSLRPAGAGVFPRPSNPRVVWLGLEGDLEPLKSLAGQIEKALIPLDFPAELQPFKPHLTLGRVKSGRNKPGLVEGVMSLGQFQGPAFEARELILFRSELKPSGAVYTALERLPLSDE
ncbi:MAG: RNA 2',3'-cyclic phosphodiesterase [Deltaproteobacteria bacterium]|nr:RNA 2',3'-cyclic phosphodiesterase [Deltaproteobacteria bacterium]